MTASRPHTFKAISIVRHGNAGWRYIFLQPQRNGDTVRFAMAAAPLPAEDRLYEADGEAAVARPLADIRARGGKLLPHGQRAVSQCIRRCDSDPRHVQCAKLL